MSTRSIEKIIFEGSEVMFNGSFILLLLAFFFTSQHICFDEKINTDRAFHLEQLEWRTSRAWEMHPS
jgi:hypothetical protein